MEDNITTIAETDSTQKKEKLLWYRNVSILIPLVALVFTVFTSLTSYIKGSHDDYLASRIELRTIISEIVKMNEDFAEITKKYANDSNTISALSAQYNTKNSILSQQALAVINRLESSLFGKNTVLDVEYMAIGQALSSSYMYDEALEAYLLSYSRATDSTIAAGSLRAVAGIYMIKGNVIETRKMMGEAANIYLGPKFSGEIEFKKLVTNANTYLQWAQVEVGFGDCKAAKEKIDAVRLLLPQIPNSPVKNQLVAQSKFLIGATANCGS